MRLPTQFVRKWGLDCDPFRRQCRSCGDGAAGAPVDVPDPVEAALLAEKAGADGITVHLREDRRHIQERDVELMRQRLKTKLNLEMAVTPAMVALAEKLLPG